MQKVSVYPAVTSLFALTDKEDIETGLAAGKAVEHPASKRKQADILQVALADWLPK